MDATLEFIITRRGKGYKVTVEGGYGKRKGFFEIDPYVKPKINDIQNAIEEQRPLDKEFVEKFGIKLFEMLFSSSKDLLHRYLDQFDHLDIVLNMKDPFLHEMPWQLCYDPEYSIYLGADSQCSLVRKDQKSTHPCEEINYPLKVLIIISSPMDLDEEGEFQPDPDGIMELMNPLKDLRDKGMVQLDFLDRASVQCIQDALKEGYHIVHFVGHGLYDSTTEKGYLVIEDRNRNEKRLEGQKIAQLFGVNPPQLVILTVCESSPLIPFLLSKKVPAVMAMQYTVLKDIAHEFMERFYSLLVKGDSIAQAVSNARNAIQLERGSRDPGWFAPVLYIRADNILQINTKSPVLIPEKKVHRHDIVTDSLGVENFVGRRKDLWLIEKALLEDDLKVVVVRGIGGIGKTALASKFVEKHKYTFRGVFAKNVADIEMGVEGILGLLDQFLMGYGDRRLHEVIGEVDLNVKLGRLNECLKDTYLIILDNFEPLLKDKRIADESMEMFLRTFLSGDHSSKIIITSQYGFTFADERAGGLIRYVDLKELNLQDTMKLLERLGIKDLKTRMIVHEEIGGNPLILELFVKLAETRSVEGLLEDLTPMREKIGELLLHELIESLTKKEQEVLKKLSVFRLKVDRSILDVLGVSVEIMDKRVYYSLVKAEHGHYFMHQGVKQYVYGLLSEDELVEAHMEAVKYYIVSYSRQKRNFPAIVELHHHLIESGLHEKAGKMAIGLVEPFSKGGYWEPLVKLLEKTMKIAEGKTKAVVLHSLGIVFQSIGKYEEAEKLYRESLDIVEKIGDKKGIAASLHQLGIIHQVRGEYKEAEKLYRESLDIAEKIGDKKGMAASYNQMGIIYKEWGDYKEAENFYRESLNIAEKIGDKKGIAQSLHQLGIIHQVRGEYEEAEKLYRESLDIAEKIGDRRRIAQSRRQIGVIYKEWGDYKEAESSYRESLNIAEKIGDKKGIAASLHHLGVIHQVRGEYKEAEKLYRESLDIAEKIGDKKGMAQSLHQLGIIYQFWEEYGKAEKLYRESLRIAESLGDKKGIAQSLHQLGIIYQFWEEYGKAEKLFRKSLNIAEILRDNQGVAASYHQLGITREKREEYQKAVKYYCDSLEIFSKLDSPDTEIVVRSLQRLRKTIGEKQFDYYWKAITKQKVPGSEKIQEFSRLALEKETEKKPKRDHVEYSESKLLSHIIRVEEKIGKILSSIERKEVEYQNFIFTIDPRYIFVIMPFAGQHIDTYNTIKRATEKVDRQIRVERVDEKPGAIVITNEISYSIRRASIIICDLTDERPNVYYELGCARTLEKPIICIAKKGTKIHLDVKNLKIIFFDTYSELEDRMAKEISELRSELLKKEFVNLDIDSFV